MIEFITYKGTKYPIRISYYVLMMAQKEAGLEISEIDKNFESHQILLWYALVSGAKMADQELTLKREDMVWVLDECYLDFQRAIFEFGKQIIEMQTEVLESKKK